MKSIRVNADYEAVLFHNRPQPKINEALEFFALYLSERPLFSQKNYPIEFLKSVEAITGRKCEIKKNGEADNWWGELRNPELERWLNSKITSTELIIREGWAKETYILNPGDIDKVLVSKTPMIAKDPFEMSGRGFKLYPEGIDEKSLSDFKNKTLILEPLLNRTHDFSHYIFPDGKSICYQNLVDQRFQYKGTLFRNWKLARVEDLGFYSSVPEDHWKKFHLQLEKIKSHYSEKISFSESEFGFSVDSLVYNETEIHPLCEVNFRRTMGSLAYDLSRTYSQDNPWTLLLLLPSQKDCEKKLELLVKNKRLIVLSPEDSRFTILFLMAESDEGGKNIMGKVRELLSLSELSINV